MAKLKDGYYKQLAKTIGSPSYLLDSGGGTKAISDFSVSSHTHSYLPLSGGTITGTLKAAGQFIFESNTTANYKEGIRLNLSTSNWAGMVIGGARNTTEGCTSGSWWVARNPSAKFVISPDDSSDTVGLTLNKGGDALWRNSKIWTSGNSNNTSSDWSAKALTLAGGISGATALSSSGELDINAASHVRFRAGSRNLILNAASNHFKPYDDNTNIIDLGTSSARWKGIYGNTLNLNGSITGATIITITKSRGALLNTTDSEYNDLLGINDDSGAGGVYLGKKNYWIRTGNASEQPKVVRNGVTHVLWHAGNDGSNSGLDADLLDGLHSSSFVLKDEIGSGNSKSFEFNTGGVLGWINLGYLRGGSGAIQIDLDYGSHCSNEYGAGKLHIILAQRPYSITGYYSKEVTSNISNIGIYLVEYLDTSISAHYPSYYVYAYIGNYMQGRINLKVHGGNYNFPNNFSPVSSLPSFPAGSVMKLDTRTLSRGFYIARNNVLTSVYGSDNFNPDNYLQLTGGTLSGPIEISTGNLNNSYNEGIRLTSASNGWVGITYGSTGLSGAPTNGWFSARNPDNQFIISPDTSSNTVGLTLNKGGDALWRNSKIWTAGNFNPSNYRPIGGSWSGTSAVPGTRQFGFISNDGSGEVAFKHSGSVLNMIIDGEIWCTDSCHKVWHAGIFNPADKVNASSRSNWNDKGVISNVIGQLAWKNYGNGHTIFDASNSTTPSGTSCNNTNPSVNWSSTYPTLMGWNGSQTYGVRVDSARNSDLCSGLAVHSGVNNEANKIVRTDGSGYLYVGWLHSTQGNENNNSNPDRVWGSNGSDSWLRTYRTSALSVDNSAKLGGIVAANLKPKVSLRDFTNGTLIRTSIDYSQTNGAAWVLKIHGNIYGNGTTLNLQAQGYIYNNTIINTNAIYFGTFVNSTTTKLIALNVDGKLCFWFARQGYWAGYNVECYDVSRSTTYENLVTSIDNVVDPVGTKRVEIPLSQIYSSAQNNIGTGSTNYAAGNQPITAISTSASAATFTRGAGNLTLTYPTFNQNTTGNAATATKVVATGAVDTITELVRATMAANDYFRIAVGGGSNTGYAEIATGDDSNEPIYVRQYNGAFSSITRSATILDATGQTHFPEYVNSKGFKKSSSSDSYVLLGGGGHKQFTTGATASTIVERDVSGDVNCRLVRTTYGNEERLTGGIVFRVNNSSDNYLRVCSSPSAARTWLGSLGTSGGTLTGKLTVSCNPAAGSSVVEIIQDGTTSNTAPLLVRNAGNTNWGNIADFRTQGSGTTIDRPIIRFSTSASTSTWGVGMGGDSGKLDDFAIRSNYGLTDGATTGTAGGWGQVEFKVSRGGNSWLRGLLNAVGGLQVNGQNVWHAGNDGSGSGLDADLLDGLHLHTGRNNEANKIVRTDSNGYIQAGYINSSSGNENNNSNPDRVWGSNASDGYLRTYRTSALSVAYAQEANKSYESGTRVDITINGSSNTYYPVVINSIGSQTIANRFIVYRDYSETAPPDWYSSTHKGSLLLDFEANYGGWGGSNYDIKVNHHRWTYVSSSLCAGIRRGASEQKFVIWLRGGGAIYHILSPTQKLNNNHINIYYALTNIHTSSGYTDNVEPITSHMTGSGNPDYFKYSANGAIYDRASRVYSANNNNIGTGATNYAAGNHTHSYLPLSGGTITGGVSITDSLLTFRTKNYSDGWFRGTYFIDDATSNRYGGMGVYGEGSGAIRLCLGFDVYPWNTNGIIINSSNNVGIGTLAPTEKLHVNGSTLSSGFKKNGSDDTYVLLGGGGHKSLSDFNIAHRLHITDNRGADRAPNYYTDRDLSTFFNDSIPNSFGTWASGITVKGWAEGYRAWQLFGYSSTGSSDELYFRSSISDTEWQTPRRVWHSGNLSLDSVQFVRGMIMMWSGATNSVPAGWLLCNGSNGTPDLRDKFVMGAGNVSTGETGGSNTADITADHLPQHRHRPEGGTGSADIEHERSFLVNTRNNWADNNPWTNGGGGDSGRRCTRAGWEGHVGYTGKRIYKDDGTNIVKCSSAKKLLDIKPSYYALAFIMKS